MAVHLQLRRQNLQGLQTPAHPCTRSLANYACTASSVLPFCQSEEVSIPKETVCTNGGALDLGGRLDMPQPSSTRQNPSLLPSPFIFFCKLEMIEVCALWSLCND